MSGVQDHEEIELAEVGVGQAIGNVLRANVPRKFPCTPESVAAACNALEFDDSVQTGLGVTENMIELQKANLQLLHIFNMWDVENFGYLEIGAVKDALDYAGIKVTEMEHLHNTSMAANKFTNNFEVFNSSFPKFMLKLAANDLQTLGVFIKRIKEHAMCPISEMKPNEGAPAPHKQIDSAFVISHNKSQHDTMEAVAMAAVEENIMKRAAHQLNFVDRFHKALTMQSGIFPMFIAVCFWQFGFTFWYHLYLKFRYSAAFYYSAQAGLSVGFGALNEEHFYGMSDDCSAPTVDGSCLNGGDGLAGCCTEWGNTDDCSNKLSEADYDVSKFVTVINVLLGSSAIGGALGFLVEYLNTKKEVWYADAKEAAADHHTSGKKGPLEHKTTVCEVITKDFEEMKVQLILLLFVVVGITYGMVHEKWSFITSLYFAITAMSTAGLQGISDPKDDFSCWFTGVYVLLGVPLYGMALGIYAGGLVEAREQAELERAVNKQITATEFRAKTHGDSQIEPLDFLEIELLRCGITDMDFLDHVRQKFAQYDIRKNGVISFEEMTVGNVFRSFDADDSGRLTKDEFQEVLNKLREHDEIQLPNQMSDTIFAEAAQGDNLVSIEEFLVFLDKIMQQKEKADQEAKRAENQL